MAQNISTNDPERGLQILFKHISPTTFHNSHRRLNEVNRTIVREWVQKWSSRLKTTSDISISSIEAEPLNPEQLIVDVFTWLSDLSSPYPIMWIHHQDRSQTSFFAHVIADILDELRKLSGSFFCTKVDGDIDITHVIPTLAFQLAQNIPGTRSLITQAVVQNLSIFDVRAKSQIEKLILDPLLFASQSENLDTRGIPNVFLIHGLEEFDDGDQSQLSFLYAFSDALTQLAAEDIPYRLLVVGRDSSYISKCLSNTDLRERVLDRSITEPASLGEEEADGEDKDEVDEEDEDEVDEVDEEERREAKRMGDIPWDLMNTLKGHTNSVTAVIFSADGTTLASASYDKTLRLWDGKTGNLVAILDGHTTEVNGLAFSPNGSRLASRSYDKIVRLWDAKSASLIANLHGHSIVIRSVAFSPDGSRLASGADDSTVRLWDGNTGSHVATLRGHTDSVRAVAFSADGSRLASASFDHTVRLWEGRGGAFIATLRSHSQHIYSVAFAPHDLTLASGSNDNTVNLWDGKTGTHIATLKGHSSTVMSIAFSPDGSILASGAYDKTVRLWDVKTGSLITILEGHSDRVQSVTFSPDGSILASGSYDKTLRLWDVRTGSLITALDDSAWPYCATFSPNGLNIAFPSSDHTIQIWH